MNYLSNITEATNASASNFIFSPDNPVNNEYSSFLESLSGICHEVATSVLQSKIFQMGLGALASMKTGSLLPLVFTNLINLPSVKPRTLFHHHIDLQPGQRFFMDSASRISLCKTGKTAWDDKVCNYAGPPMHVTILCCTGQGGQNCEVRYDGPYSASNSWHEDENCLSIEVINDTDQASSMYLHIRRSDPSNCFW